MLGVLPATLVSFEVLEGGLFEGDGGHLIGNQPATLRPGIFDGLNPLRQQRPSRPPLFLGLSQCHIRIATKAHVPPFAIYLIAENPATATDLGHVDGQSSHPTHEVDTPVLDVGNRQCPKFLLLPRHASPITLPITERNYNQLAMASGTHQFAFEKGEW